MMIYKYRSNSSNILSLSREKYFGYGNNNFEMMSNYKK
jgi:hypothetical protein